MTTAMVARVCAAAALAIVALSLPARAQYPDKNIDLIVPYGPGGGFDIYARAVAKAMENHLPKNVRVIVRNIPGAGSVNGIATMYRAAPDGYTMGIVDLPGAVAPQIMGEQLPYDLDKATWLGTVNIGVYSLVVGKKTTFSTLEAFQKPAGRPPFFATTGSNDLAMAKIAAAVLGIKGAVPHLLYRRAGDASRDHPRRGRCGARHRRRDRAAPRERRSPAARVVRQERRARHARWRRDRRRCRPSRARQSQPQPRVRGAARPAGDGAYAAGRCRAEGAEAIPSSRPGRRRRTSRSTSARRSRPASSIPTSGCSSPATGIC